MRPCGLSENQAFNTRVSRECHDLGQGRVTVLNRLRQIGIAPPQNRFTGPLRRPTVPQPRQHRLTDDSALPSTLPSSNLPARSVPSSCQISCLPMWCSLQRLVNTDAARSSRLLFYWRIRTIPRPDSSLFDRPIEYASTKTEHAPCRAKPAVFRWLCAAALVYSRLKSVPQQNCVGSDRRPCLSIAKECRGLRCGGRRPTDHLRAGERG